VRSDIGAHDHRPPAHDRSDGHVNGPSAIEQKSVHLVAEQRGVATIAAGSVQVG
jgi:hypothetical protein